jgi:hypothetical protein
MSPARARAAARSAGEPLPNATWAAFERALDDWRARLPDVVTAATIPGKTGRRQVVSTLHALGLLEDSGRPTLTLRRAVGSRSALLPALRARWPELMASLERGAEPDDVAAAFRAIPADSANTARRFRTFVLSACDSAGVDVEAYRRLGSAASPLASQPRRSKPAAPDGRTAAAVQLRRELARYAAAVDDAIRARDPDLARAWSQETARLRDELRGEG